MFKILCEGICGTDEAQDMFQMEMTENGEHLGIDELIGCV